MQVKTIDVYWVPAVAKTLLKGCRIMDSPLREISICSLQMPSASTPRSLSALRLRAGTVKIISHSKCSWKHLDIQLSIYFKCMLCSLHTLLIVAFYSYSVYSYTETKWKSHKYIWKIQENSSLSFLYSQRIGKRKHVLLSSLYLVTWQQTCFPHVESQNVKRKKKSWQVKSNNLFYNQVLSILYSQ